MLNCLIHYHLCYDSVLCKKRSPRIALHREAMNAYLGVLAENFVKHKSLVGDILMWWKEQAVHWTQVEILAVCVSLDEWL